MRAGVDVHAVNDTNHGSVNRRTLAAERFSGGSTFNDDQHFFVNAGTDGIDREQRHALRLVVERHRLDEQELGTFELAVLVRRDDGSDDTSDLQWQFLD